MKHIHFFVISLNINMIYLANITEAQIVCRYRIKFKYHEIPRASETENISFQKVGHTRVAETLAAIEPSFT